jgi:DNA-binding phage protein
MNSFPADVSHHEREVAELRADRGLAVEYLRLAVQSLEHTDERVGGMLALSALAEAYGDLAILAVDAGVVDAQLYRLLARSGVPQFNTPAEYETWFGQQMHKLTLDPGACVKSA